MVSQGNSNKPSKMRLSHILYKKEKNFPSPLIKQGKIAI